MQTVMPKILLVGSGITGSLVASLLHQNIQVLGHERNVEITVWDKSRGTGGRMSTSRSPFNSKCTADLGAQYISCTPQYATSHKMYYDELLQAGILEPLKQTIINMKESEEGTQHYVVPNGMSSLVKYFMNKSELQPNFEHHMSKIEQLNGKWCVTTLHGKSEIFDAVVLTMPVPQLLNLEGLSPIISVQNAELKKNLEAVSYSSRYALALFYEEGASLNLPFNASYLNQDPIFRFISIDSVKRNRPELPISVVLHTSVPFGLKHIDQTVKEVEPILMNALKQSFPNLPQPKAVKCHKWRFSQVFTPYSGQPGVLELSRDPLLLVGGDGFTHSNFDGCISSAESIVNALS